MRRGGYTAIFLVPKFTCTGLVLRRRCAALRARRLHRATHCCRRRSTATLHDVVGHVRTLGHHREPALEIYTANDSRSTSHLISKSWQVSSTLTISYFSLVVLAVASRPALLQLFLSHTARDDRFAPSRTTAKRATLRHELPHIFGSPRRSLSPRWRSRHRLRHLHEFFPSSGGGNLLFAFEAVVIGALVHCGDVDRGYCSRVPTARRPLQSGLSGAGGNILSCGARGAPAGSVRQTDEMYEEVATSNTAPTRSSRCDAARSIRCTR